jgi:adhesin/invasin
VIKTGGTVIFSAGVAVAANSTITGSGPVIANRVATSTITITLNDINNNLVSGETPTFTATDTGINNLYTDCSVTNTLGISTCTLASLTAETKTLSLVTPVSKSDGTVIFTAGVAVALNSTITGSGPVVANDLDTSTVTITLKDANLNPVSGQSPAFLATDTAANNSYGTCSVTNAAGISTCTLSSPKAESKTLTITSPVSKSDGSVLFTADAAVAANSTITGSGPVTADGAATSTVTITLKDSSNNPVSGQTPSFTATDSGPSNIYGTCSVTDASGVSTCLLSSFKAETKTLSITGPFTKADGTVLFTAGTAVAVNSTITGSGPVIADGAASSTITIALRDINNNLVSGVTPTFSATDTSTKNTYTDCSITNASGVATCTMQSKLAETKLLSILTPFTKTGGNVVFTAGAADPANSNIIGTGPVLADGLNASTVIITLRDAFNNSVSGQKPTFSATNSGNSNMYGDCSFSDSSGASNCTLKSTTAELKTLSILTPISKADGTVLFNVGPVSVANSSISGTGPVAADGEATSTITITLKDAGNNAVAGQTPTFAATNTGTTNIYGDCSLTDAFGVSTCTMTSKKVETKTLNIATPVNRSGGTVVFTVGAPASATSTITGTSSIVANGLATSTVTVTLLDAFYNPILGQTPTFSATGTTNSYGACSLTDAFGVSTCTLKSTKAESKTLSIATPVSKADGSVIFIADSAVALNSTISGTGPTPSDGSSTSTITITLGDAYSNPVAGQKPTFDATGTTNIYGECSFSDASGVSTCTMASFKSETKTLSIMTPVSKTDGTVLFIAGGAVAANSSITGSGPVIANGSATSTVTITLKDISNNPVAGFTPTFDATGTTNIYGSCSVSDASGISTCTLASTKAEIKTLAIASPVVKSDGSVTFTPGAAVAANSLISGTSSIVANAVATSTVTITLLDLNNNPVSGQVPTFNATNTGTTNIYGDCSSSNASGISTCTLASKKAEVKTLAITAPVTKTGTTTTFIAGAADPANSDISGTSPVSADGISVSFITIALNDAFLNPIVGIVPIFNATSTGLPNIYGSCSLSDASGVSMCTLASNTAELKTLQLTSPTAVTGSVQVEFSAMLPTSANSTIAGTSTVTADGVDTSTITITLKDASNNAVPGIEPQFDATDTGTTNIYDACSMSDAGGVSLCTLASTKAESKILRITNPVLKSGGTVVFTAGIPVIANSSITGTGPVVANGSATSTITINLKDFYNNTVAGSTPTFSATNTGNGNTHSLCSSSDASGNSTCTLKSTKAESKIPQILTPVVKSGSGISFVADVATATNSTIAGTSPVNPDGTSTSEITITLKDANSNTVSGVVPTFGATGSNNTYGTCAASNATGVSLCTLASTTAETKTISIATPVVKAGGTVLFQTGSPVPANSTISGTTSITADGIATSTITITLKDNLNAPVLNITPLFAATGTGNTYSACSTTNVSGVSTCTLKSTKAEVKTLEITSPVIKPDGTVTFIPGAASLATSTIVAGSSCKANGVDVCAVTITIKDAQGNGISGTTPTFTVSGTLNSIQACSATNLSGVSTCGVTSTKAESKSFQLTSPVIVAGGSVDFNPNGINILVPIELADRGMASSSTAAIIFARTRTSMNTADYVAQFNQFQFEIVANNSNTTTSYTINLVNSAGTIITDSAIVVPPSTTAKRFNVTFTPTTGADDYRVQLPKTVNAGQIKVHSAKIVVDQTAAVATKIYIPLSQSDYSLDNVADSGSSAQVTSTTSSTYATSNYFTVWTRNDSFYDAIDSGTPWTLETVMSSSSLTNAANATLYNKTTGLAVTGATTSLLPAVTHLPYLKSTSFASNATNFTNTNNFELRINNATTRTSRLYKAGLWVKLKFLKKAEILYRVTQRNGTLTNGTTAITATIPDSRFFWDASSWSNPTVYFQTSSLSTSTSSSTVALMDHTTNDNGTTGAVAVSGATLSPGTTFAIQRTSALTLNDMSYYILKHTVTSGTTNALGSGFIVIQARD